ncbi:hypothetical protein PanWU01x14_023280, partial [Parasponia andersonii]
VDQDSDRAGCVFEDVKVHCPQRVARQCIVCTVVGPVLVERDDHHANPFLQSKGADVVVHAGAGCHCRDGSHHDFAIVLLLEELEGVDYVVGLVGVGRVSFAGPVSYEKRRGAAGEPD